MSDFSTKPKKQESYTNKTGPLPTMCTSCSFDFEEKRDPKHQGGQVNYLTCRNQNGKTVTDRPGRFLIRDNHGNYSGNAKTGYPMADNYVFVSWVVWCDACHSRATRLQESHKPSSKIHYEQQ